MQCLYQREMGALKMDRKRLGSFRRRLEREWEEVTELVVKADSARRGLDERKVGDEAEEAARSYSRDLLHSQRDTGRTQLRLVREALDRIDSGEFGMCEECGQPIGLKRLEAVPWTPYCRDCQEEIESQGPDV